MELGKSTRPFTIHKDNMNWKDLQEELKSYVTLDRFTPVEKIVYGGVAIILTGVVVALLALVIKAR